ncbi:hypothetical protein BpHYR1_039953 [Brachionus plicatilis]|uniref:Uncharacterized protein n=1 Tax=Brachionus plicatilis TaxID=10195 RepID=A0A3M7PAQ8_BRAPC|nr:hypothetical protein BpHYR1_039953 [Brachionus plicatilis]
MLSDQFIVFDFGLKHHHSACVRIMQSKSENVRNLTTRGREKTRCFLCSSKSLKDICFKEIKDYRFYYYRKEFSLAKFNNFLVVFCITIFYAFFGTRLLARNIIFLNIDSKKLGNKKQLRNFSLNQRCLFQ